jgi:hypothetical protein
LTLLKNHAIRTVSYKSDDVKTNAWKKFALRAEDFMIHLFLAARNITTAQRSAIHDDDPSCTLK